MSNNQKTTIPFWGNEPTILFNKDMINQLWINDNMNFTQKLNTISRLVIALTILGFVFTRELRFLLIGLVTLAIIYCIYTIRSQSSSKEGFEESTKLTNPESLQTFLKSEFNETTKQNPLGNVLLTDISDNPTKKTAPPSFNPMVTDDINNSTKKTVQMLNPGIKNTNTELYGDLAEKIEFEDSMRPFYSMPNTKIVNDQTAFAEFLYGNMPSCKEGDSFACIQDNLRYIQM